MSGLTPELQRLVDRAAIIDCYSRYARGVDRFDEELILSAFHPDCIDWHGSVKLSPREFVDWYFANATRANALHYIGNHTIEIDGDVAHCEAYYHAVQRDPGAGVLASSGGRYVDRFEKRDGEWRIAQRILVREWKKSEDEWPGAAAHFAAGAQSRTDRDDCSYHRPLVAE